MSAIQPSRASFAVALMVRLPGDRGGGAILRARECPVSCRIALSLRDAMSLQNPKVGFVSLGCPKALVDSERILTQLRGEGYDLVQAYDDADVVVVNTCGFIDSAVAESLDAIGEAMAANGKVIVTG